MTNKPTDAELIAFAVETGMRVRTGKGVVTFARAVLAKWGTPAPVGVEPVAWMTQEGARVVTEKTMNAARRDGGAMLTSLRSYSVALVRAVAPQPVERDPLTDLEIESAIGEKIGTPLFLVAKGIVQATESAHGITGGQHDF